LKQHYYLLKLNYKHKFQYFNVLTNSYASSALAAKVRFSSIPASSDSFFNFVSRNAAKGTQWIVGVVATVIYISENLPEQTTAERIDNTTTVVYKYELELDGNYNIIGGQWYSNFHPNFVWKVHSPNDASGPYDQYVPSFDGSVQSLQSLAEYAKNQSAANNQPLRAIVKYLLEQSASS